MQEVPNFGGSWAPPSSWELPKFGESWALKGVADALETHITIPNFVAVGQAFQHR